MKKDQVHEVFAILRQECQQWLTPSVSVISQQYSTAFHVLISCLISLRTKDAVTAAASARLFERAKEPEEMARLTVDEIAELIYPAGFYRNKAAQIHTICQRLITEFDGKLPDSLEGLMQFKGVGRKTANLVVTLGFGKPGICVDIHVHRIVNRWGYVSSKTPDQTELLLRKKLPKEYWIPINDLLVCFGQNLCYPVSPACSRCKLTDYCKRVGVARSR